MSDIMDEIDNDLALMRTPAVLDLGLGQLRVYLGDVDMTVSPRQRIVNVARLLHLAADALVDMEWEITDES